MTARQIHVCFATPACAYVKGHGSRELLTDLRGGRPPVYGTRVRAWATQPSTASDLIAVAEKRGWPVEIVSENDLLRMAGVDVAHERGQLW